MYIYIICIYIYICCKHNIVYIRIIYTYIQYYIYFDIFYTCDRLAQ